MSKKIQVTTVNVTKPTDIQVISLNAYFISKAVEAKINMTNAIKNCKYTETIVDETDEAGNAIKSHEVTKYNRYELSEDELKILDGEVLPFLEELVKAFNEE